AVGQPLRGPGLVPDELDVRAVDGRQRPHGRLDVLEHGGGERTPARCQDQLDVRGALLDRGTVQQAHVDDRDAFVPTARVVYRPHTVDDIRVALRSLGRR